MLQLAIGWTQGVAPHRVLEVRQNQLLVLLLMVQAQDERASDLAEKLPGWPLRTAASSPARRSPRQPRKTSATVGRESRPRLFRDIRSPTALRDELNRYEGQRRVHGPLCPAVTASRTNVSKNQEVCARCHLVGLASGMDWTT